MTELILVAGEALYDLVLGEDGQVDAHPGGGPFNTARTIGRLRQPVAFLGRLSTDRFGSTLERMLKDDGVRLDTVVHTDEPTTLAIAELDAGGSARYRFYERATSAPGLTPEAALAHLPDDVAILHVGTLGLTLEPIATALEAVVTHLAPSALIVVDPNVRPSLIADPAAHRERLHRIFGSAHVVKVSEEDVAWLSPGQSPPEAARALLEHGPRVVLLTRGPEGAVVLTPHDELAVQVPPTQVVDTIGAGDAFGGGFVAWWTLRGLHADDLADTNKVYEAARFAAQVASRTVERAGAEPPDLTDLEAPGS